MRATLFLLKKIRMYDKRMIAMIVLFSLLSAAYPFVWIYVPVAIIRLSDIPASHLSTTYTQLAVLLTVATLIAMTSAWGLAYLRGNYRMRMNNIRFRLTRDLMYYSLTMPYEYTLNKNKLDAIEKARESIKSYWNGAGGIILTLLQVFGTALAAIGFIGVFVSLSIWMMLFILFVIVANLLLNRKIGTLEQSEWDRIMPPFRKLNHLFTEQQDPTKRKDILSYNLYGLFKTYIDRYLNEIKLINKSILLRKFSWQSVLAFFDLIKDVILYYWLIRMFLVGTIDVALFFLYSSSVVAFVALAQQLMYDITNIRKYAHEFSAFISLDLEASEISPISSPKKYGATIGDTTTSDISPISSSKALSSEFKQKTGEESPFHDLALESDHGVFVEIRNVSFRYPGTERWVLKNLNLTIQQGEKIALVGENGSGKTTLIMLLSRLYRPTEGEILFDGVNIWDIREDEFLTMLSVVFQDAMIFPFSIRENITMSTETDEKQLHRAMENASFQSILEKYPLGLDTTLLRILDDDGIDLSSGQRQKLFLARALYKGKSRLLLLDEPTAALDPLAEQELYRHYHDLTRGQTSLFVSHRLASTQFCDRIAYLSEGTIVELGSHDELYSQRGLYHDIYEVQAKNYRDGVSDPTQYIINNTTIQTNHVNSKVPILDHDDNIDARSPEQIGGDASATRDQSTGEEVRE